LRLFFSFFEKSYCNAIAVLSKRGSAWLVGEREIERQRNGSAVKR